MSQPKGNVLLITGEGGLGDRSFNDAGFAGVRRSLKELGINIDLVELNEIGIVLGMDAPHLTRYAFSYEAGARTIDSDITVLVDIVGSFIDREKGKKIALSQIDHGVDIIYQVAGASGLGVFDAVGKKGIYAIGEGLNQNHLHPEFIVASTYKHMDIAVFEAIKAAIKGEFVGGNYFYGFKEKFLEVSLDGSQVSLSEEAKQAMITYGQKLISGEIKPPLTQTNLFEYLNTIN